MIIKKLLINIPLIDSQPTIEQHKYECFQENFGAQIPETIPKLKKILCTNPEESDEKLTGHRKCVIGRTLKDEMKKDPFADEWQVRKNFQETLNKVIN